MKKINFVNNSEPYLSAENLNQMQSNIEEAIKGEILWTNPNPTSDFGSQDITLNSSNYDVYELYYKNSKSETRLISTKSIKGYGFVCFGLNGAQQGNTYIRDISYVNDTKLNIGRCANPGVSHVNDYCVPIYIIGYKTGLFNEGGE